MKSFFAFFKRHRILSTLVLIFITGCILVALTFVGLDFYTHHGEKEVVPDVKNLSEDMAAKLLEGRELQYETVDSVYRRDALPGRIVDQYPAAGSMVKKGRKIYLTINAKAPRTVALPSARDLSLRQAKVLLEGAEFKIGKVEYKPSAYKDLVLSVLCDGNEVQEGEKLPVYSELELWVGSGKLYSVPTDSTDTADTEIQQTYDEDSFEEEIIL